MHVELDDCLWSPIICIFVLVFAVMLIINVDGDGCMHVILHVGDDHIVYGKFTLYIFMLYKSDEYEIACIAYVGLRWL